MSRSRKPIAAANWKMNLLRADAERFCAALRAALPPEPAAEVLIFPTFTLLPFVARELAGWPVACGGQDLHPEARGAHTGDVSGAQLADAGAGWVLCGHSERRQNHRESSELVARKARAAREHGLMPLICVGETRDERHAGRTFEVLESQLAPVFADPPSDFELAYEPVWAIGTGEVATAEIAQEAHRHLREVLSRGLGTGRAASVRILYGGSVKPDNAAGLILQDDIDGFLVGGASLDSGPFLEIVRSAAGQ